MPENNLEHIFEIQLYCCIALVAYSPEIHMQTVAKMLGTFLDFKNSLLPLFYQS